MRRHITIPRSIFALALLTAVSRQDYAPLVDLIAFPIALSLFVIAPLSILGVLLAPFASAFGLWLYIRHRRGHQLPSWVARFTARGRRAAGRRTLLCGAVGLSPDYTHRRDHEATVSPTVNRKGGSDGA